MNQYQGAVFFVDMLGIGALTQGKIILNKFDFSCLAINNRTQKTEHTFCAQLLINFRQILKHLKTKYPHVKFAQLSDCAFFWSKNPIDLTNAAREFMWRAIFKGLFCRGGIAYGDIVEPDKISSSIGHFVLGEAVTKAVKNERAGKGCRIFSDTSLPTELGGKIESKINLFIPLKNLATCEYCDEFRWYLFPNNLKSLNFNEGMNIQRKRALSLIKIVSRLYFSPTFRWNASSNDGKVHIAASIDTISKYISDIVDINNKEYFDYTYEAETLLLHDTLNNRSRKRYINYETNAINSINQFMNINDRKFVNFENQQFF